MEKIYKKGRLKIYYNGRDFFVRYKGERYWGNIYDVLRELECNTSKRKDIEYYARKILTGIKEKYGIYHLYRMRI